MKLMGKKIQFTKKGKKAIAGAALITVVITTGMSFSTTELKDPEESLSKTMEMTQEDTLLDDVLDLRIVDDYGDIKNLKELEKQITIYELLESQQLNPRGYIFDEEEKEEYDELSVDEIKILSEELDDSISSRNYSQRSNVLHYLRTKAENMIESAAPIITEDGLKRAIKTGVVEALDLEPEDFERVTIHAEPQGETGNMIQVTAKNKTYAVDGSSIYGKMIRHLYDVQRVEIRGFDNNLDQAKKAITLIKDSAYYDGIISRNDTITEQTNYLSEKILTK